MERRRGRERWLRRALVLSGLALGTLVVVPGGVAGAADEVAGPAPFVTIQAVADGVVLVDGVRPCSNLSSALYQPGRLEVHRSGSTDDSLTVRYAVVASVGGELDYETPSGEVIIPSGEANAPIQVNPRSIDVPGPFHDHRNSSLTTTLQDTPDYVVGQPSAAVIGLRVDVAVFECNGPPVTPAGVPVSSTTTTTAPASTVAASTATQSASLPFTGAAPLALTGAGSSLVALGALGARYGRPRWKRTRARRRRAGVS
jgi:hypothetical protein